MGGKSSTGRGICPSTETVYVIVSFCVILARDPHSGVARPEFSSEEIVQRAVKRALGTGSPTITQNGTTNPAKRFA